MIKPGYYEVNSRALTFKELYKFTNPIMFPLIVVMCKIFKMKFDYSYLPELISDAIVDENMIDVDLKEKIMADRQRALDLGYRELFWQKDQKNVYIQNETRGVGLMLTDDRSTLLTIMYVKTQNRKVKSVIIEKCVYNCTSYNLEKNKIVITSNETAVFSTPPFIDKYSKRGLTLTEIHSLHHRRIKKYNQIEFSSNSANLISDLDKIGLMNSEYKANRGLYSFVSDSEDFKQSLIDQIK